MEHLCGFVANRPGQIYHVLVQTCKKVEGEDVFYSSWSVKENVTI